MIPSEPDWTLWRTFLAVMREGTLSGAARRLALTQPTAGRHVDALEAAIGAALFTRSRGGLNPTALALSLVPHAETMAAAAESLARTASSERDEARGTVRLAASEIIGTFVLPSMLAAFRAAHPAVEIELALSNRNEDLLRREADIAVRMMRPTQEAIVARNVGPVLIGMFAHRTYVESNGLPATVDELFAHPLIGVDRDESMLAGASIGGRPVTRGMFAMRCDSDVAQLMLVRAGCGIGVCQMGIAANDPGLVAVLPGEVSFRLDMWVAMHEDLRGTRRIRLLFDHLAGELAAYARLT